MAFVKKKKDDRPASNIPEGFEEVNIGTDTPPPPPPPPPKQPELSQEQRKEVDRILEGHKQFGLYRALYDSETLMRVPVADLHQEFLCLLYAILDESRQQKVLAYRLLEEVKRQNGDGKA